MPAEWNCADSFAQTLNVSLSDLLGPADGIDVDPERVLAQAICVARRLDHDREDGAPALRGGELSVVITPFDPCDPEALRRRSKDTRHLDRDLHLAKLG